MSEGIWALTGVALGGLISGGIAWRLQVNEFKQQLDMFRLTNLGKETVKAILTEMLNHKSYTDRSFFALRERVGGFTDDELRQLLHEIGARKTSRDNGAEEWWYLESRKEERAERKRKRKEEKRNNVNKEEAL